MIPSAYVWLLAFLELGLKFITRINENNREPNSSMFIQQFIKSNEMNNAQMLMWLNADFVALNLLKFKTVLKCIFIQINSAIFNYRQVFVDLRPLYETR